MAAIGSIRRQRTLIFWRLKVAWRHRFNVPPRHFNPDQPAAGYCLPTDHHPLA
jgi:hypothetical protein